LGSRLFKRFIQYCLLSLLAVFTFVPQSQALDLDAVRFGLHQDKTRLVLDLDRSADFRAFVLGDPYRMVIDLPAFEWKAGDVDSPHNAGVLETRHGNLKPGISRIVFDMNRPVSIQKAFTLPRNGDKPPRLVIDFANVSAGLFTRTKSSVFGTLNVDDVQSNVAFKGLATPSAPIPPKKAEKPLIMIDPGHGGVDPGAVGSNGVYEKKVVLALAKELKKQLEDSGQYRVKLTRETDIFIKLSDRVKIAREHGADLFISIHADSLENHSVSGASVYTLSEKASDAQTARLAARENKVDLIAGIDLSVEDQDVVTILTELAMRDTTNQSKYFANTLVDHLRADRLKTLDTAHRYAGFAVLKAPDVPSVLIEAGFMSNKNEANQLNSASHRKKIAKALKKGVDRYFEQVRKNQRI